MTELQFKEEVLQELINIKKFATPEEIANLDIEQFDPSLPEQCIYGLMTGNCSNSYAKLLIGKCCVRIWNTKNGHTWIEGVDFLTQKSFEEVNDSINGEFEEKALWPEEAFRNYQYLSLLEGYIVLKDAQIETIFKFLKDPDKIITANDL